MRLNSAPLCHSISRLKQARSVGCFQLWALKPVEQGVARVARDDAIGVVAVQQANLLELVTTASVAGGFGHLVLGQKDIERWQLFLFAAIVHVQLKQQHAAEKKEEGHIDRQGNIQHERAPFSDNTAQA